MYVEIRRPDVDGKRRIIDYAMRCVREVVATRTKGYFRITDECACGWRMKAKFDNKGEWLAWGDK
jgi:hypothetical protein